MKGEVIGVAVAQIIRGQNLNFAIPAERVLRLNTRNSRTFAQWDADVKKQWHADAEEVFRKGLFLVWKEDYQEALACFEEVIEKKPDYAEAHFFLGLCRAGLGDYGGAITAYKQALQINPDYGWAHYGLGLTYLLMGDRTSAMEEYRILSNLDSELAAELYQTINE